MKLAIQGTCLCGVVQLGVARRPRQVTQWNCSVCRRCGTLRAYYRPHIDNLDILAARRISGDRLRVPELEVATVLARYGKTSSHQPDPPALSPPSR